MKSVIPSKMLRRLMPRLQADSVDLPLRPSFSAPPPTHSRAPPPPPPAACAQHFHGRVVPVHKSPHEHCLSTGGSGEPSLLAAGRCRGMSQCVAASRRISTAVSLSSDFCWILFCPTVCVCSGAESRDLTCDDST